MLKNNARDVDGVHKKGLCSKYRWLPAEAFVLVSTQVMGNPKHRPEEHNQEGIQKGYLLVVCLKVAV